jgi:hypothetical protein
MKTISNIAEATVDKINPVLAKEALECLARGYLSEINDQYSPVNRRRAMIKIIESAFAEVMELRSMDHRR